MTIASIFIGGCKSQQLSKNASGTPDVDHVVVVLKKNDLRGSVPPGLDLLSKSFTKFLLWIRSLLGLTNLCWFFNNSSEFEIFIESPGHSKVTNFDLAI